MNKTVYCTIILLLMLSVMFMGCVTISGLERFMGTDEIQEVVVREGNDSSSILLININGRITHDNVKNFGPDGDLISHMMHLLAIAEENKDIKGIVIKINSPGGTVTACDILYHLIEDFKTRRDIPVVISMMDVATAGALYVSMAADYIMAHPTTVTGNIGVVTVMPQSGSMLEMVAPTQAIEYTGDEELLETLEDFAEEVEIVSIVEQYFNLFYDTVKEKRSEIGMNERNLHIVMSRPVVNAEVALENHLIDEIGYITDAVRKCEELANLNNTQILSYSYFPAQGTSLYSNVDQGSAGLNINLDLSLLSPKNNPQFFYVWLK